MSDFLLGGTYPTSIKLGNTIVSKLMMGSVQVWPRIVAVLGGFGRLYNWYTTQPRYSAVKYGYLYNGYAATDVRNIANIEWHLPLESDFLNLVSYLGGQSVASGTLKEAGYAHWMSPNTGGANTVGFKLLPAGHRGSQGLFLTIAFESRLLSYTEEYSGGLEGFSFRNDTSAVVYLNLYKYNGNSIRLLKDGTSLLNGQTGTYTGNDGRVYPTICIGTQEWISCNLAETKYRDGSLIPKVTDNAAWAALTTGAMCAYNNDEANVFETASIAPVGWHVPTITELATLETAVGGASIAGGKLKEMGLVHWLAPNTGATNMFGFNAKGAGLRGYDGSSSAYENLKNSMYIWSCTPSGSTTYVGLLAYFMNLFSGYEFSRTTEETFKVLGASLRLIKDDSTDPLTLTDIDGNIYPTVKIGTQVWTAANWKCTKYNDGTPIPNVTDNAAWAALTTGAQCIYNNDNSNL